MQLRSQSRKSRPKPPPELAIAYRPIDSLTVDPENAKLHPDRQMRILCKAIETYGICAPIIIDRDGKIISGHARADACKRLGWESVPTIQVEHMDPAMARAFALAENRISELGKWDDVQLVQNLKALAAIDLGFSIEATGFTMGEIDLKIEGLGDLQPGAADPADEPIAPGPSVARLGDTWILGDHRVICASALEQLTYEQLLGEDRVAAVFADPPYNVRIDGHVSGKGRLKHREFVSGAGELSGPEFTAFLSGACRLAAAFSIDGSVHYWCMDWAHIHALLAVGAAIYDKHLNICVWTKHCGGMGGLYRSAHEMVAVYRKGSAQHRNNVELGRFGRNRTNVWSYPGANAFLKSSEEADLIGQHPTPKPVALVADALLDVTARRDLVLDGFLGSGSTLMACGRIGRRCRGIELDPLYVDLTIRRWRRMTGETAIRERDGKTFDELERLAIEAEAAS